MPVRDQKLLMSTHRFVIVDSVTEQYLSDQECDPTDRAYGVIGIRMFLTGHIEAALAFFTRPQAFQFVDRCAPLYRHGNVKGGDDWRREVHVVHCVMKEQTKQCLVPASKQRK